MMIDAEILREFIQSTTPDRSAENPIFRYMAACAARILNRDYEWAGEIGYAAFTKAHTKRHEFRGNAGQFRTWIGRIASNLAISELRKSKPELAESWKSMDEVRAPYRDPADALYEAQQRAFLRNQILGQPDVLSPFEQDCLRYTVYVELSVTGTAEHLGKPKKSIENALYIGKQKLHTRAERDGLCMRGDRVLTELLCDPSEFGHYRDTGIFIKSEDGKTYRRHTIGKEIHDQKQQAEKWASLHYRQIIED